MEGGVNVKTSCMGNHYFRMYYRRLYHLLDNALVSGRIRTNMIKVPYSDMDFVWINGHYDIHLQGLCRYDGALCKFYTDGDTFYNAVGWWNEEYEIDCYVTPIVGWERLKWKLRKIAFEICIGYHWTYPQRKQGVHFYTKRPKWFWRIVFKSYYGILHCIK